MKHFNFRLQNLLHLRESLEKMQGASLGHAEQAEGARRAAAAETGSRLASVEEQATGEVSAPRAAGLWHAFGLSVEAARARADHASDELRAAEARSEVELQRFNEARAARRVLEKLRERRAADWEIESVRKERDEQEEQLRNQSVNRPGEH